MDEEKIFGPLTLRQFFYAAAGFGLCYLSLNYLESKYAIPIVVVLAAIVLALILNSPKIVIDENYLKIKQANSKNSEEFERWLKMEIAMIKSQIHFREQRSSSPDPKLESMLKLLESKLNNTEIK